MDSMGNREMVVVGSSGEGEKERERGKGEASRYVLLYSVSDSPFCQQPCPFHLLLFVRMGFFLCAHGCVPSLSKY